MRPTFRKQLNDLRKAVERLKSVIPDEKCQEQRSDWLGATFSLVAYRLQWQTRSLVEVESAFDHGEVATAPNRTTKVVLDAEGVACSHADADVVALPDLLPGPETRWWWWGIVVSGACGDGVNHRYSNSG